MVGVSENIKGAFQNAGTPFFFSNVLVIIPVFFFYKEGFMMYAGMELKYRSCVLLVILVCSKKRQCQLLIKEYIVFLPPLVFL